VGAFFQKGYAGLGVGFRSGNRTKESRSAATDNDDSDSTNSLGGIGRIFFI
jgi:hypothetical protein